jgi:hypothetical protein
MEARDTGDLARMQRPLRGVQRSQHFGPRSPRDRAGPLGFKTFGGRVLLHPLAAARPSSRLSKRVDLYRTS